MKFKKLLAAVLAIAMIASFVPLMGTTAKAAGGPTIDHVDDNPVWYGKGAEKNYNGIAIDIEENTTGPYVAGDEIMFTVTFTNGTGRDITSKDGTNLKIHLYNTAENLIEKNIKPDIDFAPTGNLQYKFTAHSESPVGGVTTFESLKDREIKYKNPVFKNGASITVSLYYKVREADVSAGKHLKNFIMIYLGSTDAAHAVGRYVQSAFTEVVDKKNDVGTLTITNKIEPTNPGKEFDYIVTLSDKSVNETLGGIDFKNGVGTFKLKDGESKKIEKLVAGTGYTVEESNYDGYTVTNAVEVNEFGSAETVNGYTAKGTVATGSEATVTFTNKEKVVVPTKPTPALTYHLNPPDGTADQTWVDKSPKISNEKTATFDLKGFENTDDGPFSGLYREQDKLKKGKYTASGGKTWYFAGWETSKTAADAAKTYNEVEYAINNLNDNVRGYTDKGRPSHTITVSDTALGNNNLYAVWFEKPGMVGYTMTLTGAKFPSMTMGGMILGDNGLTNTKTPDAAADKTKVHAQKYVVWNDGGHYYDKTTHESDEFHITEATPTNPDGYNFLGWFVKNANKASSTAAGFGGCPDPNKSYIAMPGSTIKYGAVETIYSLDALWGMLSGGVSVVVPYDGTEYTVDVTGDNAIKAEFPATSISEKESKNAYDAYNAFFADDTLDATKSTVTKGTNSFIHYYVTVEKDGVQDGSEVELINESGHYLPTQKEPGIYTYTISARLEIKDPSHENAPTTVSPVTLDVGAVSLQLVILPEIEVEITKKIDGRNFVSDDSFKFKVDVTNSTGVNVNPKEVTITDLTGNHKETVKIGFPVVSGKPQVDPGTYTVTVSETGTEEEFANKGMIKAPDVTFTFDIAVDEDTGAVTVSNIKGDKIETPTDTATGITVPITMTNEYKTGSLTVTNKIIPAETDPQQPFTFTVQFDDSGAGLDFSKVNSTTPVSGADDTFTFDVGSKKATITIKNTGTVTITGIPVGAKYEVTQDADHSNFTSSLTTNSKSGEGSISLEELDKTVEIENYFIEPSSLTIYKTVTNDKFMTADDKTEADAGFKVHVTLTKADGFSSATIQVDGENVSDGDATDDKVEFDITVKDSKSVKITGIPTETGYTVSEDTNSKYTVTYNGMNICSGKMVSGGAANVIITNSYIQPTGQLTINKKIDGNSLTKPGNDTQFDFEVTLYYNGTQLDGVNKFGGTTFTNGVATVKVSPSTPVTIINIPQGLKYEVKEINVPEGASVSYDKQSGTIDTATAVTVTNTYTVDTCNLTIKNIVVGADTGTKQKFSIKMDDLTSFQYQVNSGTSVSSTGNEVTDIELGDGDTVTILNVPKGATYSVNETNDGDADYTSFSIDASPMPRTMARAVTEPNSTGNRTLNENTTVSYINAYTGTLKLQVKLDGEGEWPNKEKSATFEFRIKIDGADDFTGTVNTLNFVDGEATVELTVGVGAESASKSWVMPVAEYTVTQVNDGESNIHSWKYEVDGGVTSSDSAQVDVESRVTSTVTVTNTYTIPPRRPNKPDKPDPKPDPGDIVDRTEHYGYIIGVTPDEVRPEQSITRAEIATILFRLLTDEARQANWSEDSGFPDVESGAWYNHAVATLHNLGIVKGDDSGLFNPDDEITRAEVAAMVVRFYEKTDETDLDNRFTDVDETKWYAREVLLADRYGLMQGDGDEFRPEDLLQRAEAMTVFNRLLGRKPHMDHLHEDMIVWTDNSDRTKWYYADVQEATNSHECGEDVEIDGKTFETWSGVKDMRDWAALEY